MRDSNAHYGIANGIAIRATRANGCTKSGRLTAFSFRTPSRVAAYDAIGPSMGHHGRRNSAYGVSRQPERRGQLAARPVMAEFDPQNDQSGDESQIVALASGLSVRTAVKRTAFSESTAYRRLRDPAFRQRVDAARGMMFNEALGRLADVATALVVPKLRRHPASPRTAPHQTERTAHVA